jgi:hypothetical protein
MGEPTLKQVLERHRGRLLQIDAVVGIAIATSQEDPSRPCIVVYADVDEWPQDLPRELDGYPVELHKVGGFEAL